MRASFARPVLVKTGVQGAPQEFRETVRRALGERLASAGEHGHSIREAMRFDDKARENLEAVERLLPDDTGELDALNNAAASRAYYAAYVAVVDRALRQGRSYTSIEHGYFRHDLLPSDAVRWHILDDDASDGLAWLRDLRIKADYLEDRVSLEEASDALDVARSIVDRASEEQ